MWLRCFTSLQINARQSCSKVDFEWNIDWKCLKEKIAASAAATPAVAATATAVTAATTSTTTTTLNLQPNYDIFPPPNCQPLWKMSKMLFWSCCCSHHPVAVDLWGNILSVRCSIFTHFINALSLCWGLRFRASWMHNYHPIC